MKKEMLEEFIKYAKEQFGCDIIPKKSSVPDTFEGIFGISFLEQDMELDLYENMNVVVEYVNTDTIPFVALNGVAGDCWSIQELGLAA